VNKILEEEMKTVINATITSNVSIARLIKMQNHWAKKSDEANIIPKIIVSCKRSRR
jgi:hypothetical protein